MKLRARWLGVALAAIVLLAPLHAATLRWAARDDILTLDPHSQNHTTTHAILMHAYEGLTRYGPQYAVEPGLASAWTFVTPTQVRFELRRGVKFHDGTAFTADDVLFSFERISQPQGNLQIYVTGIAEIRKIDDYTVDFILSGPNPLLLRSIIDFRIMSKSWAEQNQTTIAQDYKKRQETYASRNANGTGPYRITGWQPDERVRMGINTDWWDKPGGNITEVIYTPITSDATRLAALRSGEVDLVTDVPTQDVSRLRSDSSLSLVEGPETRTIFVSMDQSSPELKHSDVKGSNPFKDKRVREALNISIDREEIKRSTMRGLSMPAGILVAPGVNGHSPDIDRPLRVDRERARKLLTEAGYPNGFEFQLNCPTNRYVNDEAICQNLAIMWARLGIRTQLVSEPMATFIAKVLNFDTSAFLLGVGVPTYDAQFTLQSLLRTRTTGPNGNLNYAGISDARLDQLIDAMKTETDPAKRNAMIREALVRARDEFLYIPLHHQVRPWAMKRNVDTVYRSDDRPEARFTRLK